MPLSSRLKRAAKALLGQEGNVLPGEPDANIFLLHIPKCGGVSIGQAIGSRFDPSHHASLRPAPSTQAAKLMAGAEGNNRAKSDYPILKFREGLLLYFMGQPTTKYVSGHFTFSDLAHREFGDRFCFVTMLRDPVERWISSYFYNRYKDSDHCKIHSDIETHLESDFGKSQGFEMVKFIGGADAQDDYCSPCAIERAKEHLQRFAVVGLLENTDRFVNDFELRFGYRLQLEHHNVSPRTAEFQQSVVHADVRRRVEEVCEPDSQLYRFAQELVLTKSD